VHIGSRPRVRRRTCRAGWPTAFGGRRSSRGVVARSLARPAPACAAVEIRGEKVSSIITFRRPDLVTMFGFPATLEPGERPTAAIQRTRPTSLHNESDN
jgi:hypothetical protein